MEIGLNSDTGTVNWKYKNVLYSYVAEGIIFAAESNDIIYLEIYENKTFSYRFINLNGKDILWYDENGNLKLFDSDGNCIIKHRYNELKTVKVSKDLCIKIKYAFCPEREMKYQRYPRRLDMFFIALLTEKHYLLYV